MTTAANTVVLGEAPLRQARNSAAFWTTTGRARGHDFIVGQGFVAVAGDERAGLRVLIQEPALDADRIAEITDLVRGAKGPVDVEDPFSSADLRHLHMRTWQMPVMLRGRRCPTDPRLARHARPVAATGRPCGARPGTAGH